MNYITLSQLNSFVSEVIELSMPEDYWTVAEIASINDSRGHCYMELVEKDDRTNTPRAQARACCWRGTWMRVAPKFMQATGEPLRPGMKVLLCLHANFHMAYGFSWVVKDIDPSYTLGDMARRREEILRILKEEGVIDMNKTITLPLFMQRIAVISSATAAGYGDFCKQLTDNDRGLVFYTQLFPAVMQGELVQDSIIAALEKINEQADLFDAVVIIRGGGSRSDLSGFDTLPLAENVANFPLPVITGIGHERDKSVLDYIACVSQKTPTAVAAFLVAHLTDTLDTITDFSQRIAQCVSIRMQHDTMLIQRLEQRLTAAVTLYTTREGNKIEQCQTRIAHAIENILLREHNRIERSIQRLPLLITTTLEREKHHLSMLEQRTKAVDPTIILKRGYSITLHNGKAVTDATRLSPNDEVEIILANGKRKATID